MKRNHLLAVMAAGLLSLAYLAPIFSQGPAPKATASAAGSRVALLDVSYIFKNHVRFQSMMEQMKKDVTGAETKVKKEDAAIKQLGERLQELRPGSKDYKDLEEDVARRRAELAITIQRQRKDFLQREAKIYYNVYTEIEQELKYFCQSNAIDIVLRFNSEPVDVEKPDSVLSFINKPVIFHQGLDVTRYISDALNRRNPRPSNPNVRRPSSQPSVPFPR